MAGDNRARRPDRLCPVLLPARPLRSGRRSALWRARYKAVVYDLLFRTAAETLLTIAGDPRHLGAYLASHASHILDMAVADGRLLLMELTERATRPDTTYRQWRVGDLVLWDNRRSVHRGPPFDEAYL